MWYAQYATHASGVQLLASRDFDVTIVLVILSIILKIFDADNWVDSLSPVSADCKGVSELTRKAKPYISWSWWLLI